MEDLLSKRKEDFLSKPGAKIVYRWAFSLMLGIFIAFAYLIVRLPQGEKETPFLATTPAWVPLIVAGVAYIATSENRPAWACLVMKITVPLATWENKASKKPKP